MEAEEEEIMDLVHLDYLVILSSLLHSFPIIRREEEAGAAALPLIPILIHHIPHPHAHPHSGVAAVAAAAAAASTAHSSASTQAGGASASSINYDHFISYNNPNSSPPTSSMGTLTSDGVPSSTVASQYRCYDCGMLDFDNVEAFLEHIRVHDNNPILVPNNALSSPANLTSTASSNTAGGLVLNIDHTHNYFKCPKCSLGYEAKTDFIKHLKSSISCRATDEAISKMISEQLSCNRCHKRFTSLSGLKNHGLKCLQGIDTSSHSGHRAQLVYDNDIQLRVGDKVEVFCCPIGNCVKSGCITLRAFKMHAKCVHKQIDLKPVVKQLDAKFICRVRGCGKLFIEESQLEIHIKHHENYTPRKGKYTCDICAEGFYQINMLKKHLLSSHPNQDPNLIAGKSEININSQATIEIDERISLTPGTKMTIYKCPLCGKESCTDLKSFKLHAKHIHPDIDLRPIETRVEAKFICQVAGCGKMYIEKRQFEIHRRHHKTYVKSKGNRLIEFIIYL